MKKLVPLLLAAMLLLTGCMGTTVDQPSSTPSDTASSGGGGNSSSGSNGNTDGIEQPVGPVGGQDETGLPPLNTTDPITLHYATWDDWEMAEVLAEKFTEKYPNITVIVDRPGGTGEYMSALLTMAANREMPDVYQILEIATPINNGWFYDFTEYWIADPDASDYLNSLVDSLTFDGQRVMQVVGEYLPEVAYLDRAVFNKLNVPMPDFNWTYEEMIQLIRDMTRPDQNIFGYNYMGGAGLVTMAPIVLNDALSEFGWDGGNYHMAGAWADSVNLMGEFQLKGNQAVIFTEAWLAASGDPAMWPGNSGLVAMQLDAWWTYNNIYSKSEAKDKGVDMIPYVMPRGENSKTNRKPGFLDYTSISSGTQHPREAYELLKWMSFSSEAWMLRIEYFPKLVDEAGNKLYDIPNCFPVTNDPAVWAAYRTLYPSAAEDEFLAAAFDAFLELCREPVPLGSRGILGFDQWLVEVYQNGDFNGYTGVETAVFAGALNANDAVAELEAKGREYYLSMIDTFYAVYGRP